MTTKSKILAALRKLDYADQMRILDSVKHTLTHIHERKQTVKDWGDVCKTLVLEENTL